MLLMLLLMPVAYAHAGAFPGNQHTPCDHARSTRSIGKRIATGSITTAIAVGNRGESMRESVLRLGGSRLRAGACGARRGVGGTRPERESLARTEDAGR